MQENVPFGLGEQLSVFVFWNRQLNWVGTLSNWRSGVREVILRPPKTAVDIQQDGMRSLRTRQTDFKKLIRIGAIRDMRIGWRLRAAGWLGGVRNIVLSVASAGVI